MADRVLFQSVRNRKQNHTDTVNHAGGAAYRLAPDQALAQFAATGCFGATFYASAERQLDDILRAAFAVSPEMVAKTAVYARQRGHMKDMPALLCAVLAARDGKMLEAAFPRAIDSPKMLRNFVQMIRSGAVGRRSLGTLPRRLIRRWLDARSCDQLLRGSVGQSPSLADIVKMVHPKPEDPCREAFYGFLIGRGYDEESLPLLTRHYCRFMKNGAGAVPDLPMQMLTALPLTQRQWKGVAKNASWQTTRMNLNTFARHGVFDDRKMIRLVADRLRDPEAIAQARVFPYQLLVAYYAASSLPREIRGALQDAMELATASVPEFGGRTFVFPDVSGSMQWPVTGYRAGASSVVRCVDVAALVAATVLRRNPDAVVVPFESKVVHIDLNPRDSIVTIAKQLASLPCGGTNCSAALEYVNRKNWNGDLFIYVSDNESWVDSPAYGRYGGSAAATMREWMKIKRRNPSAKLVCIDLQPNETTQAASRHDVLNIGGFSDQVFDVVAQFAKRGNSPDYWVRQIRKVEL